MEEVKDYPIKRTKEKKFTTQQMLRVVMLRYMSMPDFKFFGKEQLKSQNDK